MIEACSKIYDYGYNNDGQRIAVDRRTGEVIPAQEVVVPQGAKVYTEDQLAAIRAFYAKKDAKKNRKALLNELGYFYFILRENQLDKLSAETAARLIYLCTFLSPDNYFMWTQRTHIRKCDLEFVLRISRGTKYNFWEEVSGKYIAEDEKGLKLVNSEIIRGAINGNGNSYQKLFVTGIRNLYEKTKPTYHKHLGYIYKLLPFINLEYNVICWNPLEQDSKLVNPMTVQEFCKNIGYDAHDFSKLKKIYDSITFTVDDHQEYFLSYVTNGEDKQQFFVNPHILYCGTDYKQVEVLGIFQKAA